MGKESKEHIKRKMQAIKNKGSKIEELLAKALWNKGYRYSRNVKGVTGTPDILFKSMKIAIFVDSEFWHGKNWKERKHDFKSNRKFWHQKIARNIERDKDVTEQLQRNGYLVLRFWGERITRDLNECVRIVEEAIRERKNKKHPVITKSNP